MKRKYIVLCLALCLLYGCKCSNFTCPGFSQDDISFNNFTINDTLMYVDMTGAFFKFIITEKNISSSYRVNCQRGEVIGTCGCGPCGTNGNIKAVNDSSVMGANYLKISASTISLDQQSPDQSSPPTISFKVFNFNSSSNLRAGNGIDGQYHETFIKTIALGSHTYSNVYLQELDTILSNPNGIISAYFTKQNGIIGFYDRLTHTLFYRQ